MKNDFGIKKNVFGSILAAMVALASTSLQAELSQNELSFKAEGGSIIVKRTAASGDSMYVENVPNWLSYTESSIDDGKWKKA